MRVTTAFAVFLLLFLVCTVWPHDKEKHSSPAPTPSREHSGADIAPLAEPVAPVAGRIDEFPTLHPLVVHFPIMLLLLAAALQIAALFVFKREFGWIVFLMAILGSIGAYLASNVFHPHTTGLSENAQRLLLEHELYAQITFWFALVTVLVKGVSVFLKRSWWSEILATLLLLVAATAVSITGHHGAELVHKEGVGPQGRFLEAEHDH